MRKALYLTVLGVAASGLMLAAPAKSQAEHRRSSFGFGVDVGNAYFNYHHGGHRHHPRHYYSHPRSHYHYYPRYEVIYHPEYSHWTPDIGWHSHGHYHVVPRYRHYHHYGH